MTNLQQLKLALFDAPRSLTYFKRSSLSWLTIYSLTGIITFSSFAWLMLSNQEAMKSELLEYLFPKSWHDVSGKLAEFLFESQAKSVLSNMILSGSLVMASILLFPIKEKYSAEFEKSANYNNGEAKEFPLIYQAWEEVKLFLLYLTSQSLIIWIGYYPYQWTTWISIGLSYLFLLFTFSLDFISPTLQRHRTTYSLILKILLRKPLLALSFGLLFSLPVILLSQLVFSYEALSLIEIASILFLINIIFLTLAVPAGTHIASCLLPEVETTPAVKNTSIVWGFSIMFLLLTSTLFLHSRLVASLHHKSQLLKAEYNIDWSSIDYQLPSFSQLTEGKALSQLSFDMVVKNPTKYDIAVETSQIIIEQKKMAIAQIALNGFALPSGESHRVKIKLDSNSNLNNVSNFTNLLDGWRVDIHLQVWPGIPFVINIIEP